MSGSGSAPVANDCSRVSTGSRGIIGPRARTARGEQLLDTAIDLPQLTGAFGVPGELVGVQVALLTRSTRRDLISRGGCINPALPQLL